MLTSEGRHEIYMLQIPNKILDSCITIISQKFKPNNKVEDA